MATLESVDFDPFKKSTTPDDFSARYGAAAEKAAKALGVDPKVVLGQWGLETGWGKSVIPGTNNLGNIKDFGGGGVAATDNMTGSRDKYRAYESPDQFVDDYVSLIQRKYPNAVNAKTPEDFAKALKSGGYAEDPGYVAKVKTAASMAPTRTAAGPTLEPVDFDPFAKAAPATPEPAAAPVEGGAAFGVYPKARRDAKNNTPNASDAIVMGLARGIRDPIDTGAELLASGYDRLTGNGPNVSGLVTGQQGEGARVRAMNQQGKQDFADQYGGSSLASGARVGGNILATLPVGPALGAGAKAVGMERLGNALASGGMTAAQKVGPGFLNSAADLGIRSLGGAATGAATAGLIDPDSTALGAGVGAALPIVGRVATLAGNALGSAVRPFYAAGQNRIAGDVLRNTAANPTNALSALRGASPVVPGSIPTTAMAAGDEGLAALSRTMQNASPEYASALAARQTAQNQARTAAIEEIAGNTGKIDLAKAARDSSTGPMREAVLEAAGSVPSDRILKSIDRLIKNPNNAGELSQQALNKFRDRIAGLSDNGAIDARALYEVRKDINTMLSGKLQGEAGNLRYASSQLGNVKSLIDDAIDQASRRVATPGPVAGSPLSTSREIVPFMPSTEVGMPRGNALQVRAQGQVGPVLPQAAEEAVGAARPTWRGYLQSYADQSIPIRQMEKLDEILKTVQTGTVDSQGGAILSAAKLNNLLKNQGSELAKDLSPQQLQILRNIQADLNAGQIASNVGRAVGSNTVQNLAQNQLLQGALGNALGGSTAATSTLGRLLQLPYGAANKQIQDRLANALLNPQEAAKLLAEPQSSALRNALSQGVRTIGYRSAPAIAAR
jgi:hypothetical protein